MFAPKYLITNSILNNISRADSSKELILNSYLIPAWETKLKQEAFYESIYSGVVLEGSRLTHEDIQEILNNRNEVMDQDSREVVNLSRAQDFLDQLAQTGNLTLESVLELHRILAEGIVPGGVLRSRQIQIKEVKSGTVSYSPPPAVEVPYLLEDLINWLNMDETKSIHPIIKAALTHFELFRIHPFVLNSNSVARLISKLVLWLNNYSVNQFLSPESYFQETEESYYRVLQSVANQKVLDPHDRDLTPWLEYFSFGLSKNLSKLKDQVREISGQTLQKDKLGEEQVLNERQITIMEYLHKYSQMKNKDFRKIFPDFSDDTVLRELAVLRKMGLVERTGRTKKATYKLAKETKTDLEDS